jgi:MOSC domain-containing protein YiiM
MEPILAHVMALAIKSGRRGEMLLLDEVEALANGGLRGDVPSSAERGVTLISAPQWQDVTRELGAELPWHTRRANVLVSAERLAPWIGRSLRIGAATLAIKDETRPCGLMDQLKSGLREALKPDARGGVHGLVVQGGLIRVGDPICLLPDP